MTLDGINFFAWDPKTGRTFLQEFVHRNDHQMVKRIIGFQKEKGKNVGINGRDSQGYSTLCYACNSTIEIFKMFMDDPSTDVNDLVRLCHDQYKSADEYMIRKLWDEIEGKNHDLCPLSYLILKGINDKAVLLLDRGDLNLGKFKYSNPPFEIACQTKNMEMIDMLFDRRDVDTEKCDTDCCNMFMRICKQGNAEAAFMFIKKSKYEKLLPDEEETRLLAPEIVKKTDFWGNRKRIRDHWMATIKMVIAIFKKYKLPSIDLQLLQTSLTAIRCSIECGETPSAVYLIESPQVSIQFEDWITLLGAALERKEKFVLRALLRLNYPEVNDASYIIREIGIEILKEILASRYHSVFMYTYENMPKPELLQEYERDPLAVHKKMRRELGLIKEDAAEMILLLNMLSSGFLRITQNEDVHRDLKHRFFGLLVNLPNELITKVVNSVYSLKRDTIPETEIVNATKWCSFLRSHNPPKNKL